jgi:ribosome-associated protein
MASGQRAVTQNTPAGSDALPELPAELSRAMELAQERKGRDMLLLDLRPVSDATDFFLILNGTSDLHVRSVAEHIVEELRKEGHRPNHIEGLRGGRWVLLDFVDFVIHVFHPTAREFYQLERLWGDAPAYHIADVSEGPDATT